MYVCVCVIKLEYFLYRFNRQIAEMFCPFSSGAPPRANVTQTEQQPPLNLKHLSEAVRTLTSPPVSKTLTIV
jgi:hypothetical protein